VIQLLNSTARCQRCAVTIDGGSRNTFRATTASAELLLNYCVFGFLDRILDKRVMVVVAEGDDITAWDLEIAAFKQVASPFKKLEVLPAVSHMRLYSDRKDTNVAAALTRDWFGQRLSF
jgi:hypothetical protein